MVKYQEPSEQLDEPELDQIFSALSDPTRREILRMLSTGQKTVVEIAEPFDASLPAVSKHIRVLESANLVSRLVTGRIHMISLRPDRLKTASEWLQFHCQFWSKSLKNLKTFLEKKKSKQ